MNFKKAALTLGFSLALVIPALAYSGDYTANTPLVIAKDDAKCDSCTKKLTALCESENKLCASKDGAASCLAYFEKCKESVRGRCGGPSLCD